MPQRRQTRRGTGSFSCAELTRFRCSLLASRCSLLAARYSLLATRYSLLARLLLVARGWLLACGLERPEQSAEQLTCTVERGHHGVVFGRRDVRETSSD